MCFRSLWRRGKGNYELKCGTIGFGRSWLGTLATGKSRQFEDATIHVRIWIILLEITEWFLWTLSFETLSQGRFSVTVGLVAIRDTI